MLPSAGGLSGFALAADLFALEALVASGAAALAESSPRRRIAIATRKPTSTALLSNSDPLILIVRAFMTSSFRR